MSKKKTLLNLLKYARIVAVFSTHDLHAQKEGRCCHDSATMYLGRPYCLALAMFLSILFPVRNVKPPMATRYFRVVNMFCEEE